MPRKVSQQKATSIRPTKDGTVVRFYNTDIVTVKPNGDIVLFTGGHNTPTTKRRMNQVADEFELYYKVYAKGGDWYVDTIGRTTPTKSYQFINDRVTIPGPAHLKENPRLRRKRKVARKKRRSPAQIAATKKLVALNKKRRKKKATKKKTRKKVTRRRARNPHPTRRRTRRKKTTRKKSTGTRLYIVFKCIGGKVYYFDGNTDRHGDTMWSSSKEKAARFSSKKWAEKIARQRDKRAPTGAFVGVCLSTTSTATIKAACYPKQ